MCGYYAITVRHAHGYNIVDTVFIRHVIRELFIFSPAVLIKSTFCQPCVRLTSRDVFARDV